METVSLTPDDFSLALHIASQREMDSLRRERTDRLWIKDNWVDELTPHLLGGIGEVAFAKWSDTFVRASVGQFSGMASDCSGNVEIRMRAKSYYDLILRENDPKDRRYVLVRGLPPNEVEIAGWCWGHEGMRDEFIANHGGYGKAWFVPAEKLRSMEEWER